MPPFLEPYPQGQGFHPKAYLLVDHHGRSTGFVGSNLSGSAGRAGVEVWSRPEEGTDYGEWTIELIVNSARTAASDLYVVVDGLNQAEGVRIRQALKRHGVSWRNIVGGRDDAEPILRLADALAGFLRDVQENEGSALSRWTRLAPFMKNPAK